MFDQHYPGTQASWAGAGILGSLAPWHPEPDLEALRVHVLDVYQKLSMQLQESTGVDIGFRQQGMLVLPPFLEQLQVWLRESKPETAHWFQAADCQSLFGNYAQLMGGLDAYEQVLHIASAAMVQPADLCRALLSDLLRSRHFQLHPYDPLCGFTCSQGRISAMHTQASEASGARGYAFDHYVLSAGVWSERLYRLSAPPDAGLLTGIEPIKGQILAYRVIEPLPNAHLLPGFSIVCDGYYAVLRPDGQVLVGSTLEHSGFNVLPTRSAYDELARQAIRMMPGLVSATPVCHWTGLRPGRSVPLIGRCPYNDNLWLNCGHFRDGFSTAPGSAELLSSLIAGELPSIDSKPYRLI